MNTNKLKEIRTHRGMSITELSRRSKINRVTLTNLESGEDNNPTLKTIFAICKVLEKNPSDIFFNHSVNHEYQTNKEA